MKKMPFWTAIKTFICELLFGFKTQRGTTTRWAWVQLLFAIAFFFISLALASIALLYTIDDNLIDISGELTITVIVIAIITFISGFIIAGLALRMGFYWYRTGSKDPTATKKDIESIKKDIITKDDIKEIVDYTFVRYDELTRKKTEERPIVIYHLDNKIKD